jgi:hypothetical protein
MYNLFNRINLAPPSGGLGGGFGESSDTIGDYNGAPGIGPGERLTCSWPRRLSSSAHVPETMLPASAERLPVALLEAVRALRADSGCGAAIAIDQSKNLGLTAAIAGRSLPTISGDQFGVSWPLPAGGAEKSRATLGGRF